MNPLQRAGTIRKGIYLGAIIVLFTVSMLWRGLIPVPLGTSTASIAKPFRWVANHTIQRQAERLEVWELDPNESEAEIKGSALRLMLTGSRGIAVTALWLSAIDKQKRNDFHEFQDRVRWVTKLQPNFITPWIFQSWNIAYNVSVEMHGSGDMYYYIVSGIQLLAEGERRNKRSPDMRYQIAFYYQNKFGVSDQVEVLRCLFDLSCIPPSQRNPKRFTNASNGQFDLVAFQDFCEKYPHLVRRLRGEDLGFSDKRAKEKLRRATPKEIIDFLRDNWEVTCRYRTTALKELTDELADADKQFPALPPQFNEGPDEAHPGIATPDDRAQTVGYFTAFKASRAWYSYSLLLLPPPMRDGPDGQGAPIPGPTPRPGEFGHDPTKHRVPRAPTMILFRQGAPRVQSYQAEMEQKEGWFDGEGWRIDDPQGAPSAWWFPDPKNPSQPKGVVVGDKRAWSQLEWSKAADMWTRHGDEYALFLEKARLDSYRAQVGDRNSIPQDPTPEQLLDPSLRRRYIARTALDFYELNRRLTNYAFFVASAEAEKNPKTVNARKTLWKAEQARKSGNTSLAIDLYKQGLDQWKEVLTITKNFHRRGDGSEKIEEETGEFELAYQQLLVLDDERVRNRAANVAHAAHAVVPFLTEPYSRTRGPAGQPAPDPLWTNANREELKWFIVESVGNEDFSSPFVGSAAPDGGPWVSEFLKDSIRQKQGIARRTASNAEAPPIPGPPGLGTGPGAPPGPPPGKQ